MIDMGDDTEISNVFHKLSWRKSRKKRSIDRQGDSNTPSKETNLTGMNLLRYAVRDRRDTLREIAELDPFSFYL